MIYLLICSFLQCFLNVKMLRYAAGKTSLGTLKAPFPQDIIIQGFGIEPEHCYVINTGDAIYLHPVAILCAVDGLQIHKATKLKPGKDSHSSSLVAMFIVTDVSVCHVYCD